MLRRRTGELLGRWHSQVDRLALLRRLAVPLTARGPGGGLDEVGLLGDGLLVGGLLGRRLRSGLLGGCGCGPLDDSLLGSGLLGSGLPGSSWLACGLGRGLGRGALGAENHGDIRPRSGLRINMSAAQVCDVCIHCLGPERIRYDLWAGVRWRTVAKPEKADGTVARSASIFSAKGAPTGCLERECNWAVSAKFNFQENGRSATVTLVTAKRVLLEHRGAGVRSHVAMPMRGAALAAFLESGHTHTERDGERE